MVWKIDARQGFENEKIKWEIVPYTRGRGLDLGCGIKKSFPHFTGVDNCKDLSLFGHPINPDVKVDTCERLEMFASGSMDFVFSSHLLEHFEEANVPAALKEWMRVIKREGYLVLYLPADDLYPKVGEPGANVDHKWNCNYENVVEFMKQAGSWDLVDFQKRDQDNEYSLLFVFRKVGSGHHFSFRKKTKPEKTAAVIRYGAFGDLLQASSVFAGLKKQGYHVTLYTSPPGSDVITHDPNLDQIILQDKDQVPNHELSDFWGYLKNKYDKFVNLSESVEGSFLAMPGRTLHFWPPAARHKAMNFNYLEMQHHLADVPHEPAVKFYATSEEKEWARKEKQKIGGFVVVWSLAGSSVHKTWPYLDNIIAALMIDFPDVQVVLVGSEAGKILEQGWENEKRVHCRAGKWSIRQSLAFADIADLVIGPETGLLNSVACRPMPKVVFLSHSTHENLTRDWVNVHPLASEKTVCPGRGNNEAPACHQMHYGWVHCKQGDKTAVEHNGERKSGVAQCQEDITPEQAYRVIWHAVQWSKEKVA